MEADFLFPPSSSLISFWDPFSPVSPTNLYNDAAVGDDPSLLDDEVVLDEVDCLVG